MAHAVVEDAYEKGFVDGIEATIGWLASLEADGKTPTIAEIIDTLSGKIAEK